jgi:hypothetical protein
MRRVTIPSSTRFAIEITSSWTRRWTSGVASRRLAFPRAPRALNPASTYAKVPVFTLALAWAKASQAGLGKAGVFF